MIARRVFGVLGAALIGVGVMASPSQASGPVAEASSFGCDTATGTQWATFPTWRPADWTHTYLDYGQVQIGGDYLLAEGVTFVETPTTVTVSGIDGRAISFLGLVIIEDTNPNTASVFGAHATLPGNCVIVEPPVDPPVEPPVDPPVSPPVVIVEPPITPPVTPPVVVPPVVEPPSLPIADAPAITEVKATPTPTPTTVAAPATLPETGFDPALLLVPAGLLIAGGVALRRRQSAL